MPATLQHSIAMYSNLDSTPWGAKAGAWEDKARAWDDKREDWREKTRDWKDKTKDWKNRVAEWTITQDPRGQVRGQAAHCCFILLLFVFQHSASGLHIS